MPRTWGIHNDTLTDELVAGGFVSVGWDELNFDLQMIRDGRDGLKAELAKAYPGKKPMSLANWAGTILRFRDDMQVGDVVVAPYRPDGTINLGVVTSDYEFVADAPTHRHRRRVEWKKLGLSRSVFTQAALYEIGSLLTVFGVRKHDAEFRAALGSDAASVEEVTRTVESVAVTETGDVFDERGADEPRASRIEEHTRDFVLSRLLREISDQQFEEFTAALLRAMGYQARATRFVGDGGIDVIAHRDPFGAEPPIIKAQCKHTTNTIGGPDVQRLVGALGREEFGLFVTLGTYSADAVAAERHNPHLRLLTGSEVVSLVLEHYERLDAKWRTIIPLRPVLAVDDAAEV
ncbi:restriction endonuclease [Cellulomonas telluris]|uniref:restriction endonuclease n=1 Tax=Cellulomonas telluris TaxID=2306636 RepID=UPI0010A84121|nr:restriction endonuclease [Cellulomonas telluris]